MNRSEVILILDIMKTSYPHFYKDFTKEDAKKAVDIWSMMFEKDNTKVVTEAVKSLICTLKYPPTIADIKEKINLITKPAGMTEMEAWFLVAKAVKNSAYGAVEEFEKLPAICKKLIGTHGQLREWALMDSETFNSVIQSNFMRSYKARAAHEKELDSLPESTKELICKSETLKIGG